MIRKIAIRTNGALVGYDENDTVIYTSNLLVPEIEKLKAENLVDDKTVIEILHLKEPILLNKWFDFFKPESGNEVDAIDKVVV